MDRKESEASVAEIIDKSNNSSHKSSDVLMIKRQVVKDTFLESPKINRKSHNSKDNDGFISPYDNCYAQVIRSFLTE